MSWSSAFKRQAKLTLRLGNRPSALSHISHITNTQRSNMSACVLCCAHGCEG